MERDLNRNTNHGKSPIGQTTSGVNKGESSNQNTINDSNNNNPNQTRQPNEQLSDLPVVREQDNYPPIANVIRIMRRILPPHAKISDEAKEIVQESVSEFIGFVTAEANERCRMEQRRTVTADDLILAMDRLGFDDYVGPLSRYLTRYREHENQRFNGNFQEPASQQQSMPNSQPTRMAANPHLRPSVSNTEGIYFAPKGSTGLVSNSGVFRSRNPHTATPFSRDASSSSSSQVTLTFPILPGESTSSQVALSRLDSRARSSSSSSKKNLE